MSVLQILLLIVLIPVGLYLREQAYRSVHGNTTIVGDLLSLIHSVKEWHRRRQERKKYKYLNKNRK